MKSASTDLAIGMEPDLRFLVSSGGVAYGAPHNIAYGASVPLMTATAAAEEAEPRPGGTVMIGDIDMSVRARNGEWNCFGLRDSEKSTLHDYVKEQESLTRQLHLLQ